MIQYNKIKIKLDDGVYDDIRHIMETGWVSVGKHVEKLEDSFKKKFNVKHAIACSCATQGLIIALKSCGWRNKRIAVPAFTWPSTIYAIESNIGNVPVFCDIDPHTWEMDLNSLREDEYDAVISVDVFGSQSNTKTNKPIIYDAAHGFGLDKLGHRGLVEVVSFSFTKVVTAVEGGMILTNDDDVYEVAKELRRLTSRMSEVNAMVATNTMAVADKDYTRRKQLKDNYNNMLKFNYSTQKILDCTNLSVFSILLDSANDRERIVNSLRENEIGYKVYYEPIVEGLAVTDNIYSRILSLPLYCELTDEEQKLICSVANASVNDYSPGIRYLKNSGYLDKYLRNEK